jgi:hypothetical protein
MSCCASLRRVAAIAAVLKAISRSTSISKKRLDETVGGSTTATQPTCVIYWILSKLSGCGPRCVNPRTFGNPHQAPHGGSLREISRHRAPPRRAKGFSGTAIHATRWSDLSLPSAPAEDVARTSPIIEDKARRRRHSEAATRGEWWRDPFEGNAKDRSRNGVIMA